MTDLSLLHHVAVPSPILQRGFWLYVWKVGLPGGGVGHYVGMTGDTGAARAQSAANHVAAHLGFSVNASAIRKCMLRKHRARLEDCRSLDFFAFGPVYPEPGTADYPAMRAKVTALAKQLWQRMEAGGYEMLNVPPQTMSPLDIERWRDVCVAFQRQFANLRLSPHHGSTAPRTEIVAETRSPGVS